MKTIPLSTHIGALEGVAFDVRSAAKAAAADNWKVDAKCSGYPPEAFETENLTPGREEEEAAVLCAGCPVIRQCARDAITPVDMTALLGTEESPDAIMVSGVVRAGIPT